MVGFTSSRAAQGYNPQFLNTDTVPGTTAVSPSGSPDLTNRLLQIMGGQLGGTLTGGEKLSALGALLKSVSRGSQTSPQQVLQSIQQQKLGEVQGAIQIQELRKQAGQQAQRQALREELLSKAKSDEERAQIRILSDENLDKFALQRLEQKAPDMETKQRQLATYLEMRATDPGRASAYWRLINPTQVVGSIESGLKEYNVPEPPVEGAAVGAAPRGGITELTAPKPKPVEPTESERTAGFLTNRLKDALATIDRIGKANPDALRPSAGTEAVRGILGETAANVITSPERQQVEAAQIDALDAALTLGTGAAYTREQLEGYRKSYFPQVGDSAATIADKARRREVLFNSARIKAGRAAPKPSGGQKPSGPSPIRILSVKPRG
jgi:hypothetical protein